MYLFTIARVVHFHRGAHGGVSPAIPVTRRIPPSITCMTWSSSCNTGGTSNHKRKWNTYYLPSVGHYALGQYICSSPIFSVSEQTHSPSTDDSPLVQAVETEYSRSQSHNPVVARNRNPFEFLYQLAGLALISSRIKVSFNIMYSVELKHTRKSTVCYRQ